MAPRELPRIRRLFGAEEIAARVEALAGEIAAAMPDDLLVVAILKGGFVFAADLIRALHRAGMHPRVDFMTLSSYGADKESSGSVKVARDLGDDVRGRDVLLVDDILESGHTVAAAKDLLLARGARTVRLCILLDKPGKRTVDCEADYRGFKVPDRFVVGYGLDYAHYFRDLPYIGTLEDG
ncbi:MAG: hypoxanthine phosphoribosyltransferase [Alphaproteobacteria bacterium]